MILFAAIYLIFRGLTPQKYRGGYIPQMARCSPGQHVVARLHGGLAVALSTEISNYDLTYGSLAG